MNFESLFKKIVQTDFRYVYKRLVLRFQILTLRNQNCIDRRREQKKNINKKIMKKTYLRHCPTMKTFLMFRFDPKIVKLYYYYKLLQIHQIIASIATLLGAFE